MAQYVFKLPDIGEGMTEAEIAAWHVSVGDVIAEDQPLVDLMTDKATVEIPSPVAGKVVRLEGAVGERRAVGASLAVFELDGKTAAPTDAAAPPRAAADRAEPKPAPAAPPAPSAEPAAEAPLPQKPIAAPAVRRRAWELGIPLQSIRGTGPGGRILHEDLDAYVTAGVTRGAAPVAPAAAGALRDDVEEIRIVGLRRRIAERLQDVQRRIPHFSYIEEVDVTALEELRRHLNADAGEQRQKLTLLPFLIRAIVRAVPHHPDINAQFDDTAGVLRRHAAVHAGIATQTDAGLMVPVLHHAEARDLWDCAAEIARLAAAARAGRAAPNELAGSTITITSLGPLGGVAATPVINPPEVAIIGVNKIAERPIVQGGAIAVRKMMNLSSSFDHRIIDGWVAAEFIQKVKGFLEQPATLFVAPR